MKNEIALSNLLMGGLTAIGMMMSAQMPWYVGIPVTTGAIGSSISVVARHRKHKLTPNHYLDGLNGFCTDADDALTPALSWFSNASQPVYSYAVQRIPPIARTLLEAAAVERDDSWLTQKMILASKFVLGAKGSGKTTWIRYEARRFKAENPQGIERIVDLHYLDDEEEWLPGLDASDYLATDLVTGMAFIRELHQIGRDRIASKSTDHPEYKLIIDEFQGFRNRLSDDEKKELDAAIQFSQDELRKYKVNVTLTVRIEVEASSSLNNPINPLAGIT